MQYAMKYNQSTHLRDTIDELMVAFKRKNINLVDFLSKHQEQLVTFIIVNTQEFLDQGSAELMAAIHSKYPEFNFNFCIPFGSAEAEIKLRKLLQEYDLPFYFSDFVSNWDLLHCFIEAGANAITVVEQLGFELDKVARVAHDRGVKVRCFPHIAQAACREVPAQYCFFIRPEDIDKYAQYIDVLDLSFTNDRIETYLRVYSQEKEWFGKLNEIIYGLNSDIDNRCLTEHFADARMKCGKRCFKGSSCRLCDSAFALAETMSKRNLIFH